MQALVLVLAPPCDQSRIHSRHSTWRQRGPWASRAQAQAQARVQEQEQVQVQVQVLLRVRGLGLEQG